MIGTVINDHQFSPSDYQCFQAFLQETCGIVLGDNKQYLVANRMRRILAELRVSTLAELVHLVGQNPRGGLKESVIDAMTTNETFWFRDSFPFEALRDVILPSLLPAAVEPLRLWSAACSSGQEPYSLSMIVEEFRQKHPGLLRRDPLIYATDISSTMLTAARRGVYDRLSVNRGLTEARRQQFFDRVGDDAFQIKPSVASRVEFRALNLLDSFSTVGSFDVVFCRNVLIYFSQERKMDILRRIGATLRPGGCLILGASEYLPAELSSLYDAQRLPGGATFYRLAKRG